MLTQTTSEVQPPFQKCAALLERLHSLIARGEDDSAEADAIRDEMDPFWYAMTEAQRARVGGLSEDLYALTEGGPRQIPMSPEERQAWVAEAKAVFAAYRQGRYDETLKFLRRPSPSGLQPAAILFLQARCWEGLGELDVAIRFLKEAERLDPSMAIHVLVLLQKAKRVEEAESYAERIINQPGAPPVWHYLAAGVFLGAVQKMSSLAEARPVLERLVPVLRTALKRELAAPPNEREHSLTYSGLTGMLGHCYERLGSHQAAIEAFNRGLERHPDDSQLLTLRGLARYEADVAAALTDFRRAAEARTVSVWPYLFLAEEALRQRDFGLCWGYCVEGLAREGRASVRAYFSEMMGIILSEWGQPIDAVLMNFDRGINLDPENPTIKHNRAVAIARAEARAAGTKNLTSTWGTGQRGDLRIARQAPPTPTLLQQGEWLNEHEGNRIAGQLAGSMGP